MVQGNLSSHLPLLPARLRRSLLRQEISRRASPFRQKEKSLVSPAARPTRSSIRTEITNPSTFPEEAEQAARVAQTRAASALRAVHPRRPAPLPDSPPEDSPCPRHGQIIRGWMRRGKKLPQCKPARRISRLCLPTPSPKPSLRAAAFTR